MNDNAAFGRACDSNVRWQSANLVRWTYARCSNSATRFIYASGAGTNTILSTLFVTGSIGGGTQSHLAVTTRCCAMPAPRRCGDRPARHRRLVRQTALPLLPAAPVPVRWSAGVAVFASLRFLPLGMTCV